MVRYLILKGVDLNIRDEFGNTPLHLAMEDRNPNKKVIKEYRQSR
jgi:ankyrin repeat protein